MNEIKVKVNYEVKKKRNEKKMIYLLT